MKKVLIAILLLAAAGAAAWFFLARQKSETPLPVETVVDRGEPVEPQSEAVRPSTSSGRTEEQPPELDSSPMKIRFEAPAALQLNQPVPVTLLVESNPKGWPAEVGPGARLDLLLRLPVGVKLASEEGWSPAQLPPEERDDVTGPWSLYEKQVPLQIKQGIPPERLAAEKVELKVAEEGVNWIISARARLVQDSQTWAAFGVLFATLQGNEGQFHEIPKTPADIRSAKAS
ncbi:MAG: hypothetical protein Q7J69_03750 [Candidatus Omnitrophota bacterium]|nr:hypothetical protein [Candidatus Omnitrophota bacterium]